MPPHDDEYDGLSGHPQMVPDDEFASWLTPEEGISHPLRLVSSAAISWVGYDEPTGVLYVHLIVQDRDEGYAYAGVPYEVYLDFLAAPSKGKFFNWFVKPVYSAIVW